MSGPKFRTVADELVPTARAAHGHFALHGYAVRVERLELGAPLTPTLTAIRDRTTVHLDVVPSVDLKRVKEWVRYGKSMAADTRLALCVPSAATVTNEERAALRDMRVGLFVLDGQGVVESLPPQDLALAVELPDLHT